MTTHQVMTATTPALLALVRKARATPGFKSVSPELLEQIIDGSGRHVCYGMVMINDGVDWRCTWMVTTTGKHPREITIDIAGPDWLEYVKQHEVELDDE